MIQRYIDSDCVHAGFAFPPSAPAFAACVHTLLPWHEMRVRLSADVRGLLGRSER